MPGNPDHFAANLLDWYDQARRSLPWRAPPGQIANPYHVLVSELMLQQTQVNTVIPYFLRFIERFPDVADLAKADEQEVLRLWQGLGYYSRARNLHRAAKEVLTHYAGVLPSMVNQLRLLPGVGEYTAGAVASIAFDQRAPIVDGNVARVLCRVDEITTDARLPATRRILWERARDILPARRVGDFNTALMELGTLICTPARPACLFCPVARHCQAYASGVQNELPFMSKKKPTPLHHRLTLVARSGEHVLIEQRPAKGRWASLWQFPTFETTQSPLTASVASALLAVHVASLSELCTVTHALTHRRYHFTAFEVSVDARNASQHWTRWDDLDKYPMSKPQLLIAHAARRSVSA